MHQTEKGTAILILIILILTVFTVSVFADPDTSGDISSTTTTSVTTSGTSGSSAGSSSQGGSSSGTSSESSGDDSSSPSSGSQYSESSDTSSSESSTESDNSSGNDKSSSDTKTSQSSHSSREVIIESDLYDPGLDIDGGDWGKNIELSEEEIISFEPQSMPTSVKKNITNYAELARKWIWVPIILIIVSVGTLIYVNYTAYKNRKAERKKMRIYNNSYDIKSLKKPEQKPKNSRRPRI